MNTKRFRVALSYAREKQAFVRETAEILARRFSELEILFDEFHEPELARARANHYLPKLYNDESDLVVVVACSDYPVKGWCGLEWDAIHNLIQKRREEKVMLANFGGAVLPGLYDGAIYFKLDSRTPADFALGILERLALNEGQPRDHYTAALPSILTGDPAPADSRLAALGDQAAHGKPASPDQAAAILRQTFFCDYTAHRGREEQLEYLSKELQDDKRTGAIVAGIGGMGKTAFAYHFCSSNKVSERFDFVLGGSAKKSYLNDSVFLGTPGHTEGMGHTLHTIESYLGAMAAQLGVPAPGARPPKYLENEIQARVGGSRALFLLDNLETVADTTAALALLYKLCDSPKRKFLVTARLIPEGTAGHVTPIHLPRLNDGPARALVLDRLESIRLETGSTHHFSSAAIGEVMDRGYGHPLALRLLSRKLYLEGENAISAIPAMRSNETENRWAKELLTFIFNEEFLESFFGVLAVELACLIAGYPAGARERDLAKAFGAADAGNAKASFNQALGKLRRTDCIELEHSAGGVLLTMHPLVREFFINYEHQNAAGAPE